MAGSYNSTKNSLSTSESGYLSARLEQQRQKRPFQNLQADEEDTDSANTFNSVLRPEYSSKSSRVRSKYADTASLDEFIHDHHLTKNELDLTNLDDSPTSAPINSANRNTNATNTTNIQLTGSSTTSEFRRYLDEMKRNYLDRLSYSCPSKLPVKSTSVTLGNNARTTDTSGRIAGDLNASLNDRSQVRRSLMYDNASAAEKKVEGEKESNNDLDDDTNNRNNYANYLTDDVTDLMEMVTLTII